MQINLTRLKPTPNNPTLGLLFIEGEPLFSTLELPWRDNQPKISCIPQGSYECERTIARTTTGGLKIDLTLEVLGVPGRSGILFHVGNTVIDSQGCILLGNSTNFFKGHILDSRKGFERFLQKIKTSDTYTLHISQI